MRCRREFGDVTDEERRRFGAVLEQHYALIDEAIGRAIAALGPDDLLLVVSGFGMEPMGSWQAAGRAGRSAIPTSAARTKRRPTDS